METVLISGGSGLVGQALSKKLIAKGYRVVILSREAKKADGIGYFAWNPEKGEIDSKAIESADFIIHLAGANIGNQRWTKKRKKEIIDSRVKSGQLLFDTFQKYPNKLKVFISASAVGYYGAVTVNHLFTEDDKPANDFLGETCRQWESVAQQFQNKDIRSVILRSGVVLTPKGEALAKMAAPIKMGVGSALGTGKQYIPWIHIDDLCSIIIKAIEDRQMEGSYNVVAPSHINNYDFSKTIAQTLHKPFFFPRVPAFVLKLILGEMSDLVLEGSRVSSDKILSTGFEFKFPTLDQALKDVL